jgi:hypothetical protein
LLRLSLVDLFDVEGELAVRGGVSSSTPGFAWGLGGDAVTWTSDRHSVAAATRSSVRVA